MIERYDAYMFDMDGTIAKTYGPWMDIIQTTLRQYDVIVDKKVVARKVFGNSRNGLVELGVPKEDLPVIFEQWNERAEQAMTSVELYPGVTHLLKLLKERRRKTALITATMRQTAELVLGAHDIQGLFDVVVTGSDVSANKPDPQGVNQALKTLGVPTRQAIMLGDTEKDVRAARNAGVDSVLYFPNEHDDYHDFNRLAADEPTFIIRSWYELIGQLQ